MIWLVNINCTMVRQDWPIFRSFRTARTSVNQASAGMSASLSSAGTCCRAGRVFEARRGSSKLDRRASKTRPALLLQVRLKCFRHGQLDLIDIAPGPALARFERGHDRVARRVEVLGGMLPRRAIAAADVAARQAKPQMNPTHAELLALFAPTSARRDWLQIARMFANHGDFSLARATEFAVKRFPDGLMTPRIHS